MNTTTYTYHELLVTKPNAELAHMFNRAAKAEAWEHANNIWNALYARVYRLEYPNSVWSVGEARERRLIGVVNATIDQWR